MDASRVAAIAARHRAAQASARTRHDATDHDSAERLRREFDACWTELGDECRAFCDAYNDAFGSAQIYCQLHPDTIVARASGDAQETVTLTRTSLGNAHGGRITAHRYSPHAAPAELPVEGHVDETRFVLTAEGRPASPSEAALLILERFTADLASGVPAVSPE
jgi:hypothetical protein